MPRWKSVITLALSDGIPLRALCVALIVGGSLNLINQGDEIFRGEPVVWWKVALTFIVPYCVSTHGAIAAKSSQRS
jgi:hypothetical protein